MIETAIGDGTILSGLFWLVVSLTGLVIAVGFVVLMVVSMWTRFDLIEAAESVWVRAQMLWQFLQTRNKK
jgi:hypothetical protein